MLQDIAVQCISPGLPTFPSSVRDAIAKSNSIQEAQRKIIQQRIKNSNTSGLLDAEGNAIPVDEAQEDENGDVDVIIDRDASSSPLPISKKSTLVLITPSSASVEKSAAAATSSETAGNESTEALQNAADADKSSSPSQSSSKVNANDNKSNKADSSIAPSGSSSASSVDSSKSTNNPPLSSSSSLSSASKNPNIIVSGDIIIEAIPTPTQPSNPNFARRDMSMKSGTKRAAPPRNIRVNSSFANEQQHPSIRSAPLNRHPPPFSPYQISQIPGYQAYVAAAGNPGGASVPSHARTTSSAGTSTAATAAARNARATAASAAAAAQATNAHGQTVYLGAHAYPSFFPSANSTVAAAVAAAAAGGNTASTVDSANATLYKNAATPVAGGPSVRNAYFNLPANNALHSPAYPTNSAAAAAANSAAATRAAYLANAVNRLPVGYQRYAVAATPTANAPAPHVATPSVATHAAAAAAAGGAYYSGYGQPHYYRDPRAIPVYVSGRPTLPPMTASAAHWTGRTFRSFPRVNDEDEEEEDDGRDPEDAALSDNDEADTRKSRKRDEDDEDNDLDDVEQNAIGEDDERAAAASSGSKKRVLDDVPESSTTTTPRANGQNSKKKKVSNNITPLIARAALENTSSPEIYAVEAMLRAATGATGATYNSATSGGLTYEDFRHFRNNVTKSHLGQQHSTEEGIREERLKKQRFLELCSELWDLTRS